MPKWLKAAECKTVALGPLVESDGVFTKTLVEQRMEVGEVVVV